MENEYQSSTPAGGIDHSTPGPGLASGQQVGGGRFVLKQQLGQGGMGVVWLAFDKELNEHVALKFLPAPIHSDFESIDDLRMELKRNRGLAHPNIVKVYDLHAVKGEPVFFSMEYVDGPTLAKLRHDQPDRVMSWDMLAPWVKQLCEALDYAHGEKIVHRDLKPGNLMVDSKGRIKLADFGIARVVSDSVSRITMRQGTSGTLIYMSPQQLDGKHPRPTDDVYALGATLYELLTSKAPFHSGDVAHQIRSLQPKPMEQRLKDLGIANMIPPRVQKTVLACLAKEPMLRPQTAGSVAERLGLASPAPRYTGPAALPPARPGGVAIQGPAHSHVPTPRPESDEPPASEPPVPTAVYSVGEEAQLPEVNSPTERIYRRMVITLLFALLVMGGIFLRKSETWIGIGPAVNPDPQHLVWINPSTFAMGSPSTEKDRFSNEGLQTRVAISKGFWMSMYETTQGEYLAVMGSNPSRFAGDANCPVENVSWNDATNYYGKLTERERAAGRLPAGYVYRLPTEAEWEYCCRAGTTTATTYGDSLSSTQANFNGNYPYGGAAKGPYLGTTTKVGTYAPNAWGLYDMHGNVWEWCLDWYGTYPGGSVTDPRGPTTGSFRVIRGGCWYDFGRYCRSAFRNDYSPDERHDNLGFRSVLAPGQ